jgi:hypothetical protein
MSQTITRKEAEELCRKGKWVCYINEKKKYDGSFCISHPDGMFQLSIQEPPWHHRIKKYPVEEMPNLLDQLERDGARFYLP